MEMARTAQEAFNEWVENTVQVENVSLEIVLSRAIFKEEGFDYTGVLL